MIRLRRFATQDLKADLGGLYALDQVCFPPEIAYSRKELEYYLTHPLCSCWICCCADGPCGVAERQPAGFVIVERAGRRGRSAGHIVTLDVNPEVRRQGIGSLLMQAVEGQMQEEGYPVLSLEVAENNAAARYFYGRLGFVASGRIAKYYGGKIDAEVMEKRILPG